MHTPGPRAEAKRSPLVSLVIIAVVSLGLIRVYHLAVDAGKEHRAPNAGATGGEFAATGVKAIPSLYDTALSSTTISKFSWQKEGFGNIMEATFTIQNGGAFDVKDIKITCTHHAHSGTVIDENTGIIYEIVKAHSKRTFRNFNMGFVNSQAASSSCKIVDLTPTV